MSDRTLRRAMIVFAALGCADGTYLTVLHYARITVPCAANGNPCEVVQTSIYSHIFGIPVSLLGAIGYLLILITLFARDGHATRLATLGISLFGIIFSGYLTYREAFTLHAYCEWCLGSAFLMLLTFVLAAARYVVGASPYGDPPSSGESPAG
ncbi:MAG TPA: vitamin K epoxide reductase family protein [Solirubrobacteraceae bacterium]|nr:vitamin K epoxide reductase family protein [Solirubrobacteraceae bacterium]